MKLILRWVINTVVILFLPYALSGITVGGFYAALIAALILGLVNAVIRPLAILLTLPVSILTLGFFTLVINALLLWLVSSIVKGFNIAGFWPAFWAALILWLVSWLTNAVLE